MGTPKEIARSIVEGIPEVRIRPMMGEWLVYFREHLVGTIEDGHLYVTIVPAAEELLPNAVRQSPHAGAKSRLRVENVSDKAFLYALFAAMWEELPANKRKTSR